VICSVKINNSVILSCSYDWRRSNKSIHLIQNPLIISHVTRILDTIRVISCSVITESVKITVSWYVTLFRKKVSKYRQITRYHLPEGSIFIVTVLETQITVASNLYEVCSYSISCGCFSEPQTVQKYIVFQNIFTYLGV
jgi:hypothetical protein